MKMNTEFTNYYKQYGEYYINQLEIEARYKTEAENALRESLEKARVEGTVAETNLGGKLIDVAWDACRSNMSLLVDKAHNPNCGSIPIWMKSLKQLVKIYRNKTDELINLLTLSTLSSMLNGAFVENESIYHNTITAVSNLIASSVLMEASIEAFFQHCKVKDDGCMKGLTLERSMDAGIKKRVQQSYRTAYAVNRMHKEGYEPIKWGHEETTRFGAKLLEMGLRGSGFFEETIVKVRGKEVAGIKATDWLEKTWTKNSDLLSKYASRFIPTIIPPKPWDDVRGGGYYGEMQQFSNLLRQRIYSNNNSFVREYQNKLAAVDLSFIFRALNAMQETAFKINTDILDVCQDIVASGGCLGGMPQTEPYARLPRLQEPFTEEELKEHKRKMTGIIKQEQARRSKALRNLFTLSTASTFKDYERIYFPWNMDYRGRCYPMCNSLSPQGDDVMKSLLLFADPKPCKNADDYRWLAIHGANLAGHDKINFDERVKWVEDNEINIIASADDPLGYTWWSEEAKNDYPMEFLSFCMEWKRLRIYTVEHGSCIGFKSGLPIAFDGTCSGLQHFSALLRDEVGGSAVNLTPSDKVQDIYSIVADKVNVFLKHDASKGELDGYKEDKEGNLKLDMNGAPIPKFGSKTLAQEWITFCRMKFDTEGITRKVCKRSVMTLAYGSGRYGFKENLLEDILKPFILEHPDDQPFINPNQAAVYMAGLIWEAVSKTVVKAVEGMQYLQSVAGLICKAGHVVTWTTPNGLPIQQNYMKTNVESFKMRINGVNKRFYNRVESGDIDKRGQQQGISPNFIHSMDACHLQRVVVASKAEGNNNFSMIHDSFGTDMSHAGDLFRIIREQFVKLYDGQDYLKQFMEDISYLIDEDAELPQQPAFGKLNIEQVKKSNFCFA